jgi:hypothetical protein
MAETVYSDAKQFAPNGWFDITLVVAPHYASGEALSDHDLLYFDENNRLFVGTDGSVVLRTGGSDVATGPLTWTREAALTVVARSTETVRQLSVAGASPPFETSGGPSMPITPLPERVFILGGPTGAQEGADLRAIDVLIP